LVAIVDAYRVAEHLNAPIVRDAGRAGPMARNPLDRRFAAIIP
jgi:hypothetical protein